MHPVKDQTQATSFSGSIDFQISECATDSKNVMVVGLFNAAKADNANSLTLQVWDAKTLKVTGNQKAADLILGTTWDDEATTDTPEPAKVRTTKRPAKVVEQVVSVAVAEPEPLPVAEPVVARGQLSLFA